MTNNRRVRKASSSGEGAAPQIWKTIVLFDGKPQENAQQNGEKKET